MIRDRRGVRYENRFAIIDGQTVVHCSLCGTFKAEENFRFVKAKKKRNSLCIDCLRKFNRERYIKNGYAGTGQKNREEAWALRKRGDLWACTKCGVEKPLDQYNAMKSKYGTAPSHCKADQPPTVGRPWLVMHEDPYWRLKLQKERQKEWRRGKVNCSNAKSVVKQSLAQSGPRKMYLIKF